MPDVTQYVQLGGQVVVVLLFLNYLSKRDNKWTDSLKSNSSANVLLAKALQRLTDKIGENTTQVIQNIPAVTKNTAAVTKNTDVIKRSGNGNGH